VAVCNSLVLYMLLYGCESWSLAARCPLANGQAHNTSSHGTPHTAQQAQAQSAPSQYGKQLPLTARSSPALRVGDRKSRSPTASCVGTAVAAGFLWEELIGY
jgi:hypothetical protein